MFDPRKVTARRLGQELFNVILTRLPSLVFNALKIRFLGLLGADIAPSTTLGNGLRILNPAGLAIEKDVAIASGVVLDARGGLSLGQGALIGFESVLLSHTHAHNDPHRPVHHQGVTSGPIRIGSNTWIGARCFVLPGVTVGRSSIVGALSVVSKDIPDDCVAGGAPARVLRPR